jgi:hypothetical protein
VHASGDSMVALAQRGVALQPAAEAVIQACRVAGEQDASVVEDGRRVVSAFHRLRNELAGLPTRDEERAELDDLLDQHAELVSTALRLVTGPRSDASERKRRELAGLGRPAARLVGLRDRIRRAAGHKGRPVEDLPPSGRFGRHDRPVVPERAVPSVWTTSDPRGTVVHGSRHRASDTPVPPWSGSHPPQLGTSHIDGRCAHDLP